MKFTYHLLLVRGGSSNIVRAPTALLSIFANNFAELGNLPCRKAILRN